MPREDTAAEEELANAVSIKCQCGLEESMQHQYSVPARPVIWDAQLLLAEDEAADDGVRAEDQGQLRDVEVRSAFMHNAIWHQGQLLVCPRQEHHRGCRHPLPLLAHAAPTRACGPCACQSEGPSHIALRITTALLAVLVALLHNTPAELDLLHEAMRKYHEG
jgi:hypothetical protein